MLNPAYESTKDYTLKVCSMQQRIMFALILLFLPFHLRAEENPLSLDVYNANLPKHCLWREGTLYYEAQKKIGRHENKALIGGIGVRSTQLVADKKNHPSSYPALVGLAGFEKTYDHWNWKTTFEAEFQGPSFDPMRTTRYTAELLGSRTINESFSAQAGAGIKFGIRSTTSYPMLGCIYTHNQWTVKLLYPKILLLSNKLSEKNTIGAFIANTLSRTYKTKKANGHKDAVCNFDAQFAGLVWQHYFTKKTSVDIAFGYCLNADVKIGNKRNNHKKTILDKGGGLLASLSVKTSI